MNPLVLALCLAVQSKEPAWVVDAATGDDANAGTAAAPFRTIGRACAAVKPGDTVVVRPGVYFEAPRLKTAGTAERPIQFRADAVAKGRVVLSGANPAQRQGKAPWTLEDAALGLYSTPFGHMPVRGLADEVDLLPYPTLEGLKTFSLSPAMPGPRHGFAVEGGKLYVRLHVKYGAADPARRRMCFSPPAGRGDKGEHLDQPHTFAWGILTDGPAHVVISGFTFEASGVAGLYIRGSHVTVRNSWFLGCRFGVAGGPTSDNDTWSSDDILVEHCDYTQFPAYADAEEVIAEHGGKKGLDRFFWWARKGAKGAIPDPYEYETGLVMGLGRRCALRNNRLFECFDALSHHSLSRSEGMEISHNRFERIVDNAIETENHAVDVRIHHNEIVDAFMAVSWQPLGGTPWPGPVRVSRNLIVSTPAFDETWRKAGYAPAPFKIGAHDNNWKYWKWMKDVPREAVECPGTGFVAEGNTVVMPSAVFVERVNGTASRKLKNFSFTGNVFLLTPAVNQGRPLPADTGFVFEKNVVVSEKEGAALLAGAGGKAAASPAEAGFREPFRFPYDLRNGDAWTSPAVGPIVK